MVYPVYQVDAFAAAPFEGNPACVCVMDEPAEADWMQSVAQEMNLSETAFLYPFQDGYQLRWFTPAIEVDLCGHATLASAHILWETNRLATHETAHFYTRSGLLTARYIDGWIAMNFPAEPVYAEPDAFPWNEVLGSVELVFVGRNRMDYLIELKSEAAVQTLAPDMYRLAQWPIRGLIVTAPSDGGESDFVSRFFAPACGIPEDPVTGSAHCALAPYWAQKLGRKKLVGYQASTRGGWVQVEDRGERVCLGGQAVTTLKGELLCGATEPRIV